MNLLDKLTVTSTERVSLDIEGVKLFFPKEIPYLVIAQAYEHEGELDVRSVFARLVALTAEDEEGNKVFNPSDWETLLNKGKRSVAPLFSFVGDLYLNLDQQVENAVEDLAKNH